jgi:hypothetical protein
VQKASASAVTTRASKYRLIGFSQIECLVVCSGHRSRRQLAKRDMAVLA